MTSLRNPPAAPVRDCRSKSALSLCAALAVGATSCVVTPASAQDRAKIAAGETVFNNNCAVCHGDGLVSTGQTFDLRRLAAADRARFDDSVRNGKNQMPPWRGVLTDDEIDQLWNY